MALFLEQFLCNYYAALENEADDEVIDGDMCLNHSQWNNIFEC